MTKGERDDGQPGNFVAELVEAELAAKQLSRALCTRFPPEPNGYLHIGHAKSIVLNFGLAGLSPNGRCNLRFDDTNPEKESTEYVESIKRDVAWLGYDWADPIRFASDYFPQLYDWAVELIKKGLAYVDLRSEEEIRATRGDFHTPGVESEDRNRSVEENLALFEKMRAGELEEGAAVLRAKIDLQSKDLKLRDPLMYRIRKVHHHRTGDDWCIYPMYDWAHGQSDAIEGITHSVCTLEFVNHRALYDWFLKALEIPSPPRQIEFGRLNLTYTVLSKRKLQQLVTEGHVESWDDPRMPTIAGMRRRGYTAEAIRAFCERIGVSKNDGVVDVGMLEYEIREHLNATSPRVMGVLQPLKLVITNYDEGASEEFEVPNIPNHDEAGTRRVPFGRELWVERDDFLEDPPKKWWRLAPGREVRLRGAALITVDEVVKDDAGEVVELRCHWDPESRGGTAPDGRKVRGTIHWVSAAHAVDAKVRLYDRLFAAENPLAGDGSFLDHLNPDSLTVREGAKLEPSIAGREPGSRVQLERLGYFVVDTQSTSDAIVLNRTIALKDSWAKIAKKR
ncbi:MAG: glutamine--tRNA ligase/YqeY domain fusion protein [Myxococcota bacterium]